MSNRVRVAVGKPCNARLRGKQAVGKGGVLSVGFFSGKGSLFAPLVGNVKASIEVGQNEGKLQV